MAREADDARIHHEVFSAELGTQAGGARHGHHAFFPSPVAECPARPVPCQRQSIEAAGRGQLEHGQVVFRRSPADDNREVIRRAGRRSQGPDLLSQQPGQVWQQIKDHLTFVTRHPVGVAALIAFAWLLTLVPTDAAGRAFAAYGGVYICASLVWMRLVEKASPDRWDLIGGTACLIGAAIILFGPRG